MQTRPARPCLCRHSRSTSSTSVSTVTPSPPAMTSRWVRGPDCDQKLVGAFKQLSLFGRPFDNVENRHGNQRQGHQEHQPHAETEEQFTYSG